tara:strand:- start:208 stop:576 length:369 start_codon:yes stop_codon:yes gene_type:complete
MPIKYDYVEDKDDTALECVKIMEGKYEGLVYQYGTVSFHEDEEKDIASVSFDYRIVEDVEDKDDNELKEILGDILVDILEEHVNDIDEEFSVEHDEVEENPVLENQILTAKNKAAEERNDND